MQTPQTQDRPPKTARQRSRERARDRLARMQARGRGSWALDLKTSALVFGGLLLASPWLMFAVFNADGNRTSPGLRALIALTALVVSVAAYYGYRASKAKVWRAPRRTPWWLRRFRPGPACTCAYCHDSLDQGAETSCPSCHAAYHPECQEELGRCASLGCVGLGAPAPRLEAKKIKAG